MTRILIIGGYGNFGRFIAKRLAQKSNVTLIIAGRTLSKAQALAKELNAEAAFLDININLAEKLKEIKPDIVIHTSGPFSITRI
jgi:saccharopine dehydrogenase-like NADP-dependent oxidoreductase